MLKIVLIVTSLVSGNELTRVPYDDWKTCRTESIKVINQMSTDVDVVCVPMKVKDPAVAKAETAKMFGMISAFIKAMEDQ
jgi:hypothetical protein